MNKISENAQAFICQRNGEQRCLTCSDEMVPVRVIGLDQDAGLALVEVSSQREEIDITLIEDVAVGDLLLAHGGVAIARLEEGTDEIC